MQRQPLEVQTIYAELLEQIAAYEASRTIGYTAGSFVTKTVKGHEYYYFQHVGPGGVRRQTYLGRRDAVLDELADRFAQGRVNVAADQRSIERLAALLRLIFLRFPYQTGWPGGKVLLRGLFFSTRLAIMQKTISVGRTCLIWGTAF